MSLDVLLHNQHFKLHHTGACYWVEQDVILLADVHLGKSAHFRKNGMAIPSSADDIEYDKLNEVVDYFKAARLWFLGDLFHSAENAEWHYFKNWVSCQPLEVGLVMGNHDIIGKHRFEGLGMKTYDHIQMGDIFLTHHPEDRDGYFNIAGHLHPSVKLHGRGMQKLKLPCFFKTDFGMVLPAFGDFTGTYCMTPKRGNRIFVIVENEVVEMG